MNFHHAVAGRLRGLLLRLLGQYSRGHHLYIWPLEAIHVEYFGADPAVQAAPGRAFEVKLKRSNRTIPVAADCSIADALCAHGIDVATSCRECVCGTCLTAVIDGTPDHRDAFLSDQERKAGDKITICVSRAKSGQLVLDI